MKFSAKLLWTLLIAGAVLAASDCMAGLAPSGYNDAPPLRGPVNGYRHSWQGQDLLYDANLRVYQVVGMPHYYFFNGNYYRNIDGRWYFSRGLDRKWRYYNWHRVPPSLAREYRY